MSRPDSEQWLIYSTCDWIQETYGITNPTLVANNPQIDAKCENIYVGEVLCVDTDDYVYPEVNQTIYDVSPRTLKKNHTDTSDSRLVLPTMV